MKILITALLIFNFGISNSQIYNTGDSLYVNAYGGLNLRNEPNSKSKVIELLNYGDIVVVNDQSIVKQEVIISGLKGNWVEVLTDNSIGFVFDGYLTKLPIIELIPKPEKFCFFNAMDDYIFNKLGVVDTTYYDRGAGGEGYYKMKIFQLKGGHQYIEHTYTESYEYELQFKSIRDSEGIQLIKNLLQVCDKLSAELEDIFADIGKDLYYSYYRDIDIAENCCSILLRKSEEMFIIRISGGP